MATAPMSETDLYFPVGFEATTPEAATVSRRKILVQDDMDNWIRSEAYTNIEHFIVRLREASARPVDEAHDSSEVIKRVNNLLQDATGWLDASASPSEPGKAFKAWLRKVEQAALSMDAALLSPEQQKLAGPELSFHLVASFGSPARLDYGTGHELSFLAYLLILRLIGAVQPKDEPALAKETFALYLDLMKRLQKVFRLEAAGKMGIWGLDEHRHLVYHWGASQARIHPSKRPALLVAPPGSAGISYLFLSSLLHLNGDPVPASGARPQSDTTRSASPSAARSEEDFQGLLRLYKHEVLDRLPVVQHFRFGPVLRWAEPGSSTPLPSTSDSLTDEELETLDSTLDKRVMAEGTVAPWSLPSLSGDQQPDEILEKLPSPTLSRTASTTSASSLPATRTGSPSPKSRASPLPYSASPTNGNGTASMMPPPGSSPMRSPMQRRMSRLSICEMAAGGGDEPGVQETAAAGPVSSVEAIREMVKGGNKELVAEGDESPFDFV